LRIVFFGRKKSGRAGGRLGCLLLLLNCHQLRRATEKKEEEEEINITCENCIQKRTAWMQQEGGRAVRFMVYAIEALLRVAQFSRSSC